jgi:hypothetical protein
MSRPAVAFLLWAAFLAVIAGVEWAIFTHQTPNYYLLVLQPAGAIAGTVVLAALAARGRRRAGAREGLEVVADLSLPSVLIGIATGLTLWGLFIGEWLLLTGAGLLVVGFAGLSRELIYARRLRRAAAEGRFRPSTSGPR